ncbi:retroviral-like aspartic protease family protein [Acetobacteraceae bacterium KSS8]|uniref:Retroviral-like aspartic protease family protein n=1 Tax=Endosaccharibacter trunci TaxID=2812733 RepID=A0ABT1W3X1_9PROT|nr:retroviral-like aspartic protease family protein [Acetobacteraceae bacterium KSS8]
MPAHDGVAATGIVRAERARDAVGARAGRPGAHGLAAMRAFAGAGAAKAEQDAAGSGGPVRRRWRIGAPARAALGVAALSAAAIGLAASPGARAEGVSCAWTLAGTAPLRSDDGFISLRATVSGRPVSFLVDTGSETGLLTPHAVSALGLPPDRAHRTQLQGTGGTGWTVQNALLPPIGLGGLVLPGGSVPVGPLPAMPVIAPPVAGLIGADLLSRFDVEFDLKQGRLLFWTRRSASVACAPPPNWSGRFDTLPMRLDHGRPVLTVRLDGRPMTALLDSGARSRIVSVRAAERDGVSAGVLAADPGGINAGVDGHESVYHWHRFRSLQVGTERFARPVLTVAPVAERFDMLLGADWFSGRDVWISYASGAVFVRAAGSPAGAGDGNVPVVRDGSR